MCPVPNNSAIFPKQKRIFLLLLVIAAVAFVVYARANITASENMAMVAMFEPDEAAPMPFLLQMIAPADNLNKALRSFLFYGYYFYGFPYFALSALIILPLQWLGQINNIPVVMLTLRMGTSVLPMLIALLLLVYMQDGFRTYRSPLIFIFLLSVPAVVSNNFWWHPDSVTFLIAILVLFYLHRDNLRFGRNFVLAAFLTGVLTATKLLGLYFFLAVALTLLMGLKKKKTPIKKLVIMSITYISTMVIAFVIANPFLLSSWARIEYQQTVNKQTALLSKGYGIIYEKGLLAAWPIMHEYYGEAIFLLIAIGVVIKGAYKSPNSRLFGLILAWFIPLTISLMILMHFKYQYWLPVALPLFSCLVLLLPESIKWDRSIFRSRWWQPALIILVLVQFGLFLVVDVKHYSKRVNRANDNERIQFYQQAKSTLQPFKDIVSPLTVYYDYRMYMPQTTGWQTETTFDLLEYDYIEEQNYSVILLLDQRIQDYIIEGVEGIDPETFKRNQEFYSDANAERLQGYHLAYRGVGLIYVRDDLWRQISKSQD